MEGAGDVLEFLSFAGQAVFVAHGLILLVFSGRIRSRLCFMAPLTGGVLAFLLALLWPSSILFHRIDFHDFAQCEAQTACWAGLTYATKRIAIAGVALVIQIGLYLALHKTTRQSPRRTNS